MNIFRFSGTITALIICSAFIICCDKNHNKVKNIINISPSEKRIAECARRAEYVIIGKLLGNQGSGEMHWSVTCETVLKGNLKSEYFTKKSTEDNRNLKIIEVVSSRYNLNDEITNHQKMIEDMVLGRGEIVVFMEKYKEDDGILYILDKNPLAGFLVATPDSINLVKQALRSGER